MKLCKDCPGRRSRMCCHTLAAPLLEKARREVQQDRNYALEHRQRAQRRIEPEPLAMTKAEAQLIGIQPGPLPSPPAIALSDGRMIRWLTGVGEFDTNDPCDEWPVP